MAGAYQRIGGPDNVEVPHAFKPAVSGQIRKKESLIHLLCKIWRGGDNSHLIIGQMATLSGIGRTHVGQPRGAVPVVNEPSLSAQQHVGHQRIRKEGVLDINIFAGRCECSHEQAAVVVVSFLWMCRNKPGAKALDAWT